MNTFKGIIPKILLIFIFIQFIPYNLQAEGMNTQQEVENFTDVTQYQNEIHQLVDLGIIKGYTDNTFKPYKSITRLEAVTMLIRELKLSITGHPDPNFKDVKKGEIGYDLIATATEAGIINGKDGGVFDSNGKLTRGQMAKILVEAYDLKENQQKKIDFIDVSSKYWAYSYIQILASNGITTGYENGTFKPDQELSRLHFVLFLTRYLNEVKQENPADTDQLFSLNADKTDVVVGDSVTFNLQVSQKDTPTYIAKWSATGGTLQINNNKTSAVWNTVLADTAKYIITVTIETTDKTGANLSFDKTVSISVSPKKQNNTESGIGTSPIVNDDGNLNPNPDDLTDETFTDTDGDGLADWIEIKTYETDPLKIDSDSDGLTDGFEVLFLQMDPKAADSDNNGTPDNKEDPDADSLTNIEEQTNFTNPLISDSDNDNILDGAEIKTYLTNPLKTDTDDDFLDDESEMNKFLTNPLNPDSDNNGILDGYEKREQQLDASALGVSIAFAATGDAEKTTTVSTDTSVQQITGTEGLIGTPIDIRSTSKFDTATLTFKYEPVGLGDTDPENLRLFYYNPTTLALELVEDQQVDTSNNQVTATLTHFSTYMLADMSIWAQTWGDGLIKGEFIEDNGTVLRKPLDLVFVIDSSGSMGAGPTDDYNKDINNNRIEGTKLVVDSLQEGDRAAIVDFDYYATLLQGLTDDKQKLKDAADKVDSSGGTNIGIGVSKALDEIQINGRTESSPIIILLTDGEGDYSDNLTRTAKSRGVVIYTMGLGTSFNAELLREIANETGGDFYHVNAAEDLQGRFLQAGDVIGLTKDTDGDTIPDWVEEKGYIVKDTLGVVIEATKLDNNDSDGDGILDQEELGNWYYNSETGIVYVVRSKTLEGVPVNPNTSDPNKIDSDFDGDNDKVDDRDYIPYTEPVVFIHGIRSNSRDVWGGDSYLDNGQPLNFLAMQDKGEFKKDIRSDQTFSKTSIFQKDEIWYAYKSDAQFGNDQISYGEPDAQYVRNIEKGSQSLPNIFPYFVNKGYKVNENLFVFNWENVDHVLYAAGFLREYLKSLSDDYLPEMNGVDVTKGYDQEITYSLVGHSAGGLVSRTYIEDSQVGDPGITKLITVDTPHWGSNKAYNGGICGSVFQDLDREDSDLFYSNPKNICKDYGAKRLNFTNKNATKYYFIGGLVGIKDKDLWTADDYYYSKDLDPILVELSSASASKTDDNLFEEIKTILENHVNITLPEPKTSRISEVHFGDNVVALGSQFGIPSDGQRNKDDKINAIIYDKAFVYIGHMEDSEHSTITHQPVIFDLIERLLNE
ncbi:S-layer homology domain-containing protein [Paenibacillus wynnii]|uniref:S-layer homology domain-containing protein n=1 Tax=Paenibacillus wynnii TaxID=268407 RepID=UPI00278D9903|nr:S-layer homology domain-containing protein [Paenibacillus wynnii]MDQ0196491.1 Mg-chelatase subunit ChlD/pimeloyl-ACP methyl ester carboxylesterase [Paenibacillus wynnii]